ncbi:MAG: hypothetical protein ACR2Q4_24815, partial [Geminicoccaceae bacterium]
KATPPSDDNRPPSKAAITFFGLMAGKENGNSVASGVVDMAGSWLSKISPQQRILALYHDVTLYPPIPHA